MTDLPPALFRVGLKDHRTPHADGTPPSSPTVAAMALEEHPDAIMVVDADDNVVLLNHTAREVVGQAADDLFRQGAAFTQLLQASDLDLDGLALRGGPDRGSACNRRTGRIYDVDTRELAMAAGGTIVVYTLRALPVDEPFARSGPVRLSPANLVEKRAGLPFPPELKEKIALACKAHLRGMRVLIQGEFGTGKTALAKHIHVSTVGAARPFVHVNCGSFGEGSFEAEMLGYERGAWQFGVASGRRGFLESAANGTLFLDEIGEMPLAAQAKLCTFLEDGNFQPIGSAITKKVELHIMASTDRKLPEMVADKLFRKDLYYRLAGFPIHLTPLRSRTDLPELVDQLLRRLNRGRPSPLSVSPDCLERLGGLDFPGNLRQLENIIDYFDLTVEGVATAADLPEMEEVAAGEASPPADAFDPTMPLKQMTRQFEQKIIDQAIDRYGSKREAAKHLGIDIATIVRKSRRTDDATD